MDLGETAFFQASRLAGLHIGLREDDILPDEDIETLSRPDPYRGLDVRDLLGQFCRHVQYRLGGLFGGDVAGALPLGAVSGSAPLIVVDELRPGHEQGGQECRADEPAPMLVDPAGQPYIARLVDPGAARDVQRRSVGKDQTVPDHQDAALPEGHLRIVDPQDSGPLRDQ